MVPNMALFPSDDYLFGAHSPDFSHGVHKQEGSKSSIFPSSALFD
jgi:hypothetical protein